MKIEKTIYNMLIENTGTALCDSGGYLGRHWEKNQKRALQDFKNEPEVDYTIYDDGQIIYTISLFHWLKNQLELNEICQAFNKINANAKEWASDSEFYGVCQKANDFLLEIADVGRTFNSYNGDSALSQVIQGTHLTINNEQYVLLQIHNGCDVRGGYTNARLFKVVSEYFGMEGVYGLIDDIQVDNRYNGYSLTDENGKEIKAKKDSKVELWLYEF